MDNNTFNNLINLIQQLQSEMGRLSKRVEDLEGQLEQKLERQELNQTLLIIRSDCNAKVKNCEASLELMRDDLKCRPTERDFGRMQEQIDEIDKRITDMPNLDKVNESVTKLHNDVVALDDRIYDMAPRDLNPNWSLREELDAFTERMDGLAQKIDSLPEPNVEYASQGALDTLEKRVDDLEALGQRVDDLEDEMELSRNEE